MSLRIRAALNAARHSGHANIVLGAFGCGAFGNPPVPTAAIFRDILESAEFRGCFQRIVFAIIDPQQSGNFQPFQREILQIDCNESSQIACVSTANTSLISTFSDVDAPAFLAAAAEAIDDESITISNSDSHQNLLNKTS
jgi:hypothetical protein